MRREKNASLLQHNTFGIDVRCAEFIEYQSVEELRSLLTPPPSSEQLRNILHIGAGSNLLFCGDYGGSILHSCISGIKIIKECDDEVWLRAGAGILFDDLIAHCLGQGFYGMENLSHIPGEVGASAVQNIGAYGAEAKDFIHSVEGVWLASGKTFCMNNEECEYAYRKSIFKQTLKGKVAITHVTFRLSKTFHPRLEYGGIRQALENRGYTEENLTADMLRHTIIGIREDKLPDPAVQGNAGSFFMNPLVCEDVFRHIQEEYPDAPHYAAGDGQVKVPAAWLIEQCGWKGRTMGRAAVHDRQPLVLVNTGGASGKDILRLCESIMQSVDERFGIQLHPEVNII